jgi:Ser/Thr protein kinase RdoA (MazF antagonist)
MPIAATIPPAYVTAFLRHCAQAGLPVEYQPGSARPLLGGRRRTHWRLETSGGPFVLSLFPRPPARHPPACVHRLHHFMYAQGIPTPEPIGALGTLADGTPFAITRFQPGQHLSALTAPQRFHLGAVLGRIHHVGQGFAWEGCAQPVSRALWAPLAEAWRRVRARTVPPGAAWLGLSALLQASLAWRRRARARRPLRALRAALPQGGVHGDIRPSNVLFVGEQPCLLDWEFGSHDVWLTDLSRTLMAFVFVPALRRGDAVRAPDLWPVLEGYQTARPLTAAEYHALPALLAYEGVLADASARRGRSGAWGARLQAMVRRCAGEACGPRGGVLGACDPPSQ